MVLVMLIDQSDSQSPAMAICADMAESNIRLWEGDPVGLTLSPATLTMIMSDRTNYMSVIVLNNSID